MVLQNCCCCANIHCQHSHPHLAPWQFEGTFSLDATSPVLRIHSSGCPVVLYNLGQETVTSHSANQNLPSPLAHT